jgi:hypothetical protein
VDTFTLPAGQHLVDTDGFFISNSQTSGSTILQVAVRGGGQDMGTCFAPATMTLPNREATCHTTRVVTVTEPTEVTVYAFGYDDSEGSADSGKFDVYTGTSAVSVR